VLPTLPKSAHPVLGFTHSLLHRQLAEKSTLSLVAIVRILAGPLPLYSVMPLTSIAARSGEQEELAGLEIDIVRSAIVTTFDLSAEIDRTADWTSALSILEGGEALLEWSRERFGDDYPLQRASVIARRIDLLRRTIGSPEYARSLQDLDRITADPSTEPMARLRLFDLSFRLWSSGIEPSAAFDEAISLIEHFPTLREHRFYIITLRDFAQLAAESDDRELRRRIESELDRVAPDGSARALALKEIEPQLLTLFESPAELERRVESYRALREQSGEEGSVLSSVEPFFLWSIGRIDDMKRVIEQAIPGLRGRGLQRSIFSREMLLLHAEALEGLGPEEFIRRCRELDVAQLAAGISDNPRLPGELVLAAAIVGDARWREATIEHLRTSDIPLARSDMAAMYEDIVAGIEGTIVVDEGELEGVSPLFRLDRIPRLRALLRAAVPGADAPLRRLLVDALVDGLKWLEERGLTEVMQALLDDGSPLLESRDAAAWTKRIEKLRSGRNRQGAQRPGEGAAVGEEGVSVSMLGRIEIGRPGLTEPVQPRGARQKSFLGAMVASEMLARPLERERFLEAVGIDPTEGKLARDAVNSAIYRLREVLGPDAILTEGETPRLNPAVVRCNLVEANRHLARAIEAARRGDLRRGGAALLRSLDLTKGEVAFPTLYESLFEALRDEFETRLRKAVLDIGGRLIEEGDIAVAERTLALAHAALAGDDDVTLLYCRALELSDKRADAELLRGTMERERSV
jgi:DNA-binding SARP family transcriptional activator